MMKKLLCGALTVLLTLSVLISSVAAESSESLLKAELILSDAFYSDSLAFFATDPTIETEENYEATQYYYSQLNDAGKQIYQALADPENLPLLKAGKPVTVGEPYIMTIPSKTTQEEYNTLIAGFTAHSQKLSEIMNETSNAVAAFDRDRSDIFWTSGVYASTAVLVNGEAAENSVSFSPGNTYTLMLWVTLPLLLDWDGVGEGDRDTDADIALLESSVRTLAQAARTYSENRYRQLTYINEQLCLYNDYNTEAAAAGSKAAYGSGTPWAPLSALDQFTVKDDADGSLKPVCEGYARALKLVCDELEIPCVTVSGTGNKEEHMWNYVQMEDGKWYAMDVTWNDSMGRNRYLLVGKDVMDEQHTPHNRFMASGQTAEFCYPVLCDTSYDPNQLTLNVDSESLMGGGTVVLQVGGILDPSRISVTCEDASCTPVSNGSGKWTVTLPNVTADYLFTATYTGEDVYHGLTATCTVQVTEHTHAYGAATKYDEDLHKMLCTCEDVIYEAHSFGEWSETQAPTEQAVGTKERTCVCGETQQETLPMLTHSYSAQSVPPTCTENGYTEHVCIYCGDIYRDGEQPAIGHAYSESEPHVCINCGAQKEPDPENGPSTDSNANANGTPSDKGDFPNGSGTDGNTNANGTASDKGDSPNSLAEMFGCSAAVGSGVWIFLLGACAWNLTDLIKKQRQK